MVLGPGGAGGAGQLLAHIRGPLCGVDRLLVAAAMRHLVDSVRLRGESNCGPLGGASQFSKAQALLMAQATAQGANGMGEEKKAASIFLVAPVAGGDDGGFGRGCGPHTAIFSHNWGMSSQAFNASRP